jgi:hypothetical protein
MAKLEQQLELEHEQQLEQQQQQTQSKQMPKGKGTKRLTDGQATEEPPAKRRRLDTADKDKDESGEMWELKNIFF